MSWLGFKNFYHLAPIYLSQFILNSSFKWSLCSTENCQFGLGYSMFLVAYCLSSAFLVECSLDLTSALYVLYSRLPHMGRLVISCTRVHVKGVEWWHKSRLPSSSRTPSLHEGTVWARFASKGQLSELLPEFLSNEDPFPPCAVQ